MGQTTAEKIFAAHLRDDHGVEPGDRVAIAMRKTGRTCATTVPPLCRFPQEPFKSTGQKVPGVMVLAGPTSFSPPSSASRS